jgi:hypothetical protein
MEVTPPHCSSADMRSVRDFSILRPERTRIESRGLSNMIASVSLDFGGTGKMCAIGKRVDTEGIAFS